MVPPALDSPAPGEQSHQPDDHGQDEQDDSDPQEEVERGNEPTGEQQDDSEDRDDDEQDVHGEVSFPRRGPLNNYFTCLAIPLTSTVFGSSDTLGGDAINRLAHLGEEARHRFGFIRTQLGGGGGDLL